MGCSRSWICPQLAPTYCQFLSAGLRPSNLLGNALERAPFLHQRAASARIALVGEAQSDDAIGAEMAIILAQLAPRCQHPAALEETERDRPDRALGALALLV